MNCELRGSWPSALMHSTLSHTGQAQTCRHSQGCHHRLAETPALAQACPRAACVGQGRAVLPHPADDRGRESLGAALLY